MALKVAEICAEACAVASRGLKSSIKKKMLPCGTHARNAY